MILYKQGLYGLEGNGISIAIYLYGFGTNEQGSSRSSSQIGRTVDGIMVPGDADSEYIAFVSHNVFDDIIDIGS